MRDELTRQLRCFSCKGTRWQLMKDVENAVECTSGRLHCDGCGRDYRIVEGILDMVGATSSVGDETDGWLHFASQEGWCEHNPGYLDVLPFAAAKRLVEKDTLTWDRHSRNFFRVLSELELADKRVLDLGAGRCWSTKYLAMQNARCVAMDLVASEHVGLRTAAHYLSSLPIFFERVRCDMNDLPFQDDSFDLVFAQGAIHHSQDMERTVREVYRVLATGGRLVFTNEWCSGYRDREVGEVKEMPGIHEHNYRGYRQYRWLTSAGFRGLRIIPDVYYFKRNDFAYRPLSELGRVHGAFIWAKLLLYGGVFNLIAEKRL